MQINNKRENKQINKTRQRNRETNTTHWKQTRTRHTQTNGKNINSGKQ